MRLKRTEFRTYPDWVHQELLNWSRWCWMGAYPHPLPDTTCGSIEKSYRHIGEDEEQRQERPIQPNRAAALKVQAVWDQLPRNRQCVLRAEYPQRHESGRVEHGRVAAARWLRLSLEQYEAELSAAIYMVMIAFEGEI